MCNGWLGGCECTRASTNETEQGPGRPGIPAIRGTGLCTVRGSDLDHGAETKPILTGSAQTDNRLASRLWSGGQLNRARWRETAQVPAEESLSGPQPRGLRRAVGL